MMNNLLRPQIISNSKNVINFDKIGLQTCKNSQMNNLMQEIKLNLSPLSPQTNPAPQNLAAQPNLLLNIPQKN